LSSETRVTPRLHGMTERAQTKHYKPHVGMEVNMPTQQFADIILTQYDKGILLKCQPQAVMDESLCKNEFNVINVYDRARYQTIDGFGGAFTEAAAVTLAQMPPEKQEEALRLIFDEDSGLGYVFCRVHIGSCDFSLENYSHADTPGDVGLSKFSIKRDEGTLIPMIKRAMVYAPGLRIFASPWSPPAWMKDNNERNSGGRLLSKYYDVWARYLCKFIAAYREHGIPLWGITTQNEADGVLPWDSCVYSPNEERIFLRDFLGPELNLSGLSDVRVLFWDHNREKAFERAMNMYGDDEAAECAEGIAVHWYTGDHFNALSMIHDVRPDKTIRFTEGCVGYDPTFGKRESGEQYAHDIIGCLNNWVSSWTDWNLLLNENGGPNHKSNWCDAPIICDTKKGELILESSYHYMAHFSRYIKPGAVRIGATTYTDRLEVAAAENPDGSIALVLLNRSDVNRKFVLRHNGKGVPAESPAHSIMTIII